MKIFFSLLVFFFIFANYFVSIPDVAKNLYKHKSEILDENLLTMAKFYLDSKLFNKSEHLLKILIEKCEDQIMVEKSKFMLNEIEYKKKNYQKAIEGYYKYIKEFPFGEHTPKAYYRIRELDEITQKAKKK